MKGIHKTMHRVFSGFLALVMVIAMLPVGAFAEEEAKETESEIVETFDVTLLKCEEHDYTYKIEIIAPTCEEEGYTIYCCECGDYYEDDYVDALGHDYTYYVEVTQPTCVDQGYTTHYCVCWDYYQDNYVDALGHDYTYYVEVTQPTCVNQGYTTHYCVCWDYYEDSYTDTVDHTMGDWYEHEAPDWETGGTERSDCRYCDYYEINSTDSKNFIGEGLSWTLENGVLTISGSGSMKDFSYNSIPWGEQREKITDIIIEEGLTNIGDYAFYMCSSLKNVNFPDTLVSIGEFAFCDCDNLTHLVFENITFLEDAAFFACDGINYVTISTKMQEIGMWMFDNELSDIYFDGTEAEWNNISINKDNVNVYNANIHFDNGYFSGGVGSKEDPYQVSSIKELNAIRYDMTPNTHYIQTADIDLIDVEWEPIGRSPSWNNEGIVKFWGVFDGNSYTISNMTITSISSENESLGLFGVNAGVLRNIQLSEITIDVDIHNECCYADIGGIAGINEGTITNCTVDGMIRSSCDIFIQNEAEYLGWTPIQRVGGIVGIGNCSNCKNYADISASGQYEIEYMNNHEACEVICGGVVGFPGTVNSEIRNCINYGSVHSSADGFAIAGGISGKDGSINYCVNYGNISSNSLALEMYTYYCQSNAGGIVGVTSADLSSHCVNFGDVSATKTCEDSGCSAGGIAGQIGYYYAGDISDCYNFADSIHADITCPEDPNDAVLVESTTYVGSIYGDWYWWDGELRAENSYSIDSTRLSDTNVDCVVGYNGEQLSDKEINLAIKDIMLALELPWQDISGNMEDGLILFSDYTNMCISVGSNITLSAGIIRNGERQKDVSGITFQVGDTSVLQVVVAGETDNTRFVELKGLAEGTTTVIFNDSITGYIATTVVTVCDNNSHAYALNNIPVQHIEKYPTNFYNVNGLYIDSYSYEINTDKSATVTFDVYNTNYTYGVVEVCDEDGNVTDAVLIEKMSSPNSDLKRALWDNIGFIIRDIRDKDLLTYRQESGFTKMTPVTVRIPEGGYIKISTSPFDSTIVALVNGADFLMSMAELGGDIDGFIENSFNYAKGLTMELIEAKAYADIVKDGSKIPEKLVKNVSL